MEKRIIFCVREGVSIDDVLPKNFGGGDEHAPTRLYNFADQIESFRQTFPNEVERYSDDDELFEAEIYPRMTDPEKKLARTYIAGGLSTEDTQSLLSFLQTHQGIEYAVLDEMNVLHYHPNDPLLSSQWAVPKISCEAAWDLSQADNILVAVIDTGVDYDHPDIAANMWRNAAGDYGYDFSDEDRNPDDSHGHGTHVAGTVAAVTNNSIGVAGIGPRAKIMAVKIFPNATDSVCSRAIKYAVDNGARVLSNSWGPTQRRPSNPVVEDAVNYAYSRGSIVVFSAGNYNDDVQHYSPANHPKVISVAATDQADHRASFSNYGNGITVAAPGVGILSLRANSTGYVSMQGTSMAAPHVSGLIALMLRAGSNVTFERTKYSLQTGADPITTDKPIGRRINALASVRAITQPFRVAGVRMTFILTDDDKDREEEIQLTVRLAGTQIGYGGFGKNVLWPDPGTYPCTVDVQPFDFSQLSNARIRMYKTPYGSATGNGMEGRIECYVIYEGGQTSLWFAVPERRYGDNNPYDVTFP